MSIQPSRELSCSTSAPTPALSPRERENCSPSSLLPIATPRSRISSLRQSESGDTLRYDQIQLNARCCFPLLGGEGQGEGGRSSNFSATLALALLALFVCVTPLPAAPKNQLPIISLGKDGRLAYDADERGNRVPDFSTCGYAGGDQPIPDAPIRVVVEPGSGDSTARIQRAIDCVGSLPADTNGFRGAVLLLKGRHEILGGLLITNSGVVLRGQGMGEDGTILVAAGLDRRTLIRVVGTNNRQVKSNAEWRIKDDDVPVGATSFHLTGPDGLKAGYPIRVIRPSTKEWIELLDAKDFGGGEGGGWKPGSRDLVWDRVVKSIAGDSVTLDAPITTAMETNVGGGRIETYFWPGRISNSGIENLQLESTFDPENPKDENHSWCALTMENTADAWVRQVTFQHFAGSAVALYESCKRVTVEDCSSLAPVSEDGGYRQNTFFTMGQQTLFLRCFAEHGRHGFSAGHCAAGPNAFVQCEAREALGDSGAIESWSSGTLFDNVRIDGNAITLGYRAGNNAGIGWAAANSVLWNCSASVIRCWNPPGAQNWSFGSWAGFEGDGIWRNSNGFMKPESLYAAQLAGRTGRRVQLMSRAMKESTNPTVEEAAELIAASHKPAPQLSDYITDAGKRNPIPSEPGNARRIENFSVDEYKIQNAKYKISVTNGWLVCDGKLLLGGSQELTWWRGSIHPDEAASFGPALTRFVPGRSGAGFTDDIGELADLMQERGAVALNHHYGLWYDLRRDDHERIRRMTGDVLPPFFEQPFARSGQGVAWDGLSKYDLTKFNPWYWSRLKQFADVCDERGLVLFHQNYFQHNIIEAGAHWVDCPWRTANNINNTGFPEPPPFTGDKRIFQAELFYDETNPVRRELHRNFIRQCLDNFTNSANVIQFTSDEFTGPKHFVEFWLDTIGEWESEKGRHPLVGLSATKDVQDAMLADAKRSALVDVIDFRYWWNTDKGLFAPNGGLNLSPRQFERQWKGGRPSEANIAQMTAEYRGRFQDKAVICNVGNTGWAYVCAGGSIPDLPKATDARMLAAIPQMKPWLADREKKLYALREAGKQILIYGERGAELNLSGESGDFRLNAVDLRTGKVTTGSQMVRAGGKLILPGGVVWLTKE